MTLEMKVRTNENRRELLKQVAYYLEGKTKRVFTWVTGKRVGWGRGEGIHHAAMESIATKVTGRLDTKAEVVRSNKRSAWVRLPDGNVVKRRAGRDY